MKKAKLIHVCRCNVTLAITFCPILSIGLLLGQQSPTTNNKRSASAPKGSTPATPNPGTNANPTLSTAFDETLNWLPDSALSNLDTDTGEVPSSTKAAALIAATLGKCSGTPEKTSVCQPISGDPDTPNDPPKPPWRSTAIEPTNKDFYCIINIVRWSVGDAKPNATPPDSSKKATVASSKWYVYNPGKGWSSQDFTSNYRLMGAKRAWLLYVHLNVPAHGQHAFYKIDVTGKTPIVLQDLLGLANYAYGGAAGKPTIGWGGGFVDIGSVPSDITIFGFSEYEEKALASNTFQKLGDPQTLDNEGKYRFDFSIGVPIKQISQLKFDTTANTVTSQKVDKQNIFGLVDFFPVPVDVKNAGLYRFPHVVAGLKLNSQPLHNILLAAGFGPAFANFYAGILWVRQDKPGTLTPGQTATAAQLAADMQHKYQPQFAFGINLTVRGVTNAAKKASK
jgi:hypothetical protein